MYSIDYKIPPETYYVWKEKIENGYYDKKLSGNGSEK
jgi:hypothetical protein